MGWATSTTVAHVSRAITAVGGDPGAVLDATLADPEGWRFERRISADALIALWERALAATGRRDIPSVAAQYAAHDERSMLAFLVSNQPSFGRAMDYYARFFPTVCDVYRWQLADTEDTFRFVATPPGPVHREGWRLHLEFEVVDSVRSAAAVTAGRAVPREVRFLHPAPAPAVVDAMAALLGVVPTFDAARCEVVYPATTRALPLPAARPALADVVEAKLTAMLDAIERGGDTTARARAAIGELLGREPCDVDAIARFLGMSRRSLERALAGEATSAGALLDDERRQRALAWLETLTVEEIAARLGYSDRRAFARAFRRWTGVSPTEARDRSRQKQD